jgi:hypothetical protein
LDNLDDVPEAEVEQLEAELIDSATASRTLGELEAEIMILRDLEAKALRLRRSENDRKWTELSNLLQDTPEMKATDNSQRKLVIFTEHRDTLNYLLERLSTLIGRNEAIVTIHGGMRREERREVEDRFRNDPDTLVLLATDAAGEGINLQRAHLMVNYDLPWNPNRLEQRFGRIHRIGQTEVCHLWNLVAGETREGAVYQRLLQKLQAERGALDGQVFDVLGKLFQDISLRELLIDSVRYGDKPEVKARLEEAIDNATDRDKVRKLLEEQSLVASSMDVSQIMRIREEMERASAKRLQPFYIKAFFLQAFKHFEGSIHERENGRYAINNVPAIIRQYAKTHGIGVISTKYERICFEKGLIHQAGKPSATFVFPGHPLLDATIGLLLSQKRDVLKRGGILVDETDPSTELRALFYLEQGIQDSTVTRTGERNIISREVHFVEINHQGHAQEAGSAPYLDYRPASDEEIQSIEHLIEQDWLKAERLERQAINHAVEHLIPKHLDRVKGSRLQLLQKIEAAVLERLTKEINFWDSRAIQLHEDEKIGKPNARLNSKLARERADNLADRLKQRQAQLKEERAIISTPPVIVGGALIIPAGLIYQSGSIHQMIVDKRITEQIAMHAVMEAEIALGNDPKDVSSQNVGYDIESRDGRTGQLRFIEVKGRRMGAETVTLTYNELLRALNSSEAFILALVEVDSDPMQALPPRYVRNYPFSEPDPIASSVNFDLRELLSMSEEPE